LQIEKQISYSVMGKTTRKGGAIMPAGRHRTFDTEDALKAAMLVFWRNGYPGTSMADLTQAMAINKPSLYAAFGNKEQLFMSALEHYINLYSFPAFELLNAPNQPLDQRLYAYLKYIALMFCSPDLPTGCMMANSTCESVGENLPATAQNLISDLNNKARQQLTDFFAMEKAKGVIKSGSSPRTLALYLMTINSGMAVLARNGTTPTELDEMIQHVITTIT